MGRLDKLQYSCSERGLRGERNEVSVYKFNCNMKYGNMKYGMESHTVIYSRASAL